MENVYFLSIAEYKITEIRSLSKSFEELIDQQKNPLVVALTETWTTEFTNAKLFKVENYQEVILCDWEKRGGGVGIYL